MTKPADQALIGYRDLVAAARNDPLVAHWPEGASAMWRWIRYEFGAVVRLIVHSDKLFVAAINGAAAGVGLAFAMACDLVIASDRVGC